MYFRLRRQKHKLVFLHDGVDRLDAFIPAHVELQDHARQCDKAPQRDDGQIERIFFATV